MRKTTKKRIIKNFPDIISAPYCALAYLFPSWQRDFFTSGVFGWNSDIFIFNEKIAISTGYRPFGNFDASVEICKKYDNLAKSNPEKIPELRKAFVAEVLNIG